MVANKSIRGWLYAGLVAVLCAGCKPSVSTTPTSTPEPTVIATPTPKPVTVIEHEIRFRPEHGMWCGYEVSDGVETYIGCVEPGNTVGMMAEIERRYRL